MWKESNNGDIKDNHNGWLATSDHSDKLSCIQLIKALTLAWKFYNFCPLILQLTPILSFLFPKTINSRSLGVLKPKSDDNEFSFLIKNHSLFLPQILFVQLWFPCLWKIKAEFDFYLCDVNHGVEVRNSKEGLWFALIITPYYVELFLVESLNY